MAKKNLKDAENHFHSIVDHAVDAIININSSGKIVYVNKSTCAAFDYREADLLGKNVTMLMPKKYRAEHKRSMGRFLKTHKPHIIGKTVEIVGVKSDGTEFPIELSLSVLQDKQGTMFAGIIRDISERKKIEMDLADKHRLLNAIAEGSSDPIYVKGIDGRYLMINSVGARTIGKSLPEIIGKPDRELFPPGIADHIADIDGWILENRKQVIIEEPINDRTYLTKKRPLFDDDGSVIGVVGISTDITEEKQAKDLLSRNSKRLAEAQRIAGMGFFTWHIRTEKIELSDELLNLCGLEPEMKLVTPDFLPQIFYSADLEYVQKNLDAALRGEKEYDIDHRIVWPDGTIRWVHVQAELTLDSEGKPETLLGTVIDITERRQNAEKVESERDMAQNYLDITGTVIVVIGRDQKVKVINNKGRQILGYGESEIIGKNWFNLVIPKKERAEVKTVFDKLMNGRIEPVEHFENRVETKNKKTRIIAWNNTVLADDEGNIAATLSSGEDITDRKEIESKLLEGEKRYRTLVESSAECICQLDLKGNFLFMNPTGLESHDIATDDELQKICCFDLAEPAYHKVLKDTLKAAKKGEVQKFEYESETVDGLRWFESIMAPITDESGKIASFIRLSNDITDRKEKESERRKNEERLRGTLQGAVKALSITTALRDPYTVSHQERVSKLACAIASELGFSEDRLEGLRTAAELHDVGKVQVPAEILTKPGVISEHEFKIIQYHVQAGFDILKDIDFPWAVADFVMQHHERLNGSGYPKGLKEEDILEEAKIIAVADVVEAMSSRRPYRSGLGIGAALQEISKNKGVLYDPKIVKVCLRLFRKKSFDFRSEKREKAA